MNLPEQLAELKKELSELETSDCPHSFRPSGICTFCACSQQDVRELAMIEALEAANELNNWLAGSDWHLDIKLSAALDRLSAVLERGKS